MIEFFFLITPMRKCYGYLLELPQWKDFNKYLQHMILRVLNIVCLNVATNLSHLAPRIHSIQTIVIMSFVIILNVYLKRVDYSNITYKALLVQFSEKKAYRNFQWQHGSILQFQNLSHHRQHTEWHIILWEKQQQVYERKPIITPQ